MLAEQTGSSNIKLQIKECNSFMETLNSDIIKSKDVLQWFETLCKHLTKILFDVSEVNKNLKGKLEKGKRDTLLLYLSQLLSSLSLLINVFVKETDVGLILAEARFCTKKQIKWSLDGVEEALTSNNMIMDPSGSFIKWMDSALDKISEIDAQRNKDSIRETYHNAKLLFEEVLCHAMSIAQVALPEDCKIIRGSSQTVLDSLDTLTKEINKSRSNPSMINLFVDSCTDKLCALERRVNTAVLKLCLKVFSEYTLALESIHKFCFCKENVEKMEALDILVADFDLHVDRIMQIGLFAVSCSTSSSRGIKIRSCLASLEALECELVPSFSSALTDRSIQNVNLAVLLENHWLRQANVLKENIFRIIDPFAFCQVIFEECKQDVDEISDIVKSKNLKLQNKSLEPLITHSTVLENFVTIVLKENEEGIKINEHFSNFKRVLCEVKCAREIFLNQETSCEKNYCRLLKRCKILLMCMKNLCQCFVEEDVEKENVSQDVQPQETTSCSGTLTGNQFLDHIITRGKQILKDRSVLYKSPMRSDIYNMRAATLKKIYHLKEQNKSVPLSKLVHLRKLGFVNSVAKNESSELQMTDILNELNNLTNTITK